MEQKREWAEITRPSAVVFKTVLETTRNLADSGNTEFALEYALAALEVFFCEETTSDDATILAMIAPYKYSVEKSRESYDAKVEANKQRKASERKYSKIAQLYKQGKTQAQIGGELDMSQQQISRYLADIRKNYSELLD